LGWARSVDVDPELCRPRRLINTDILHHARVVKALASAYATILRILLRDVDDAAGFNLMALFLIACLTAPSANATIDACVAHTVSCCSRFRRGDWAALVADANAAEDASLPRAARGARPSAAALAEQIRRMVAGFKFNKPMQSIRDFFANAALPPADTIMAKVRAKRPASYSPITPPPAATPRLNLPFDAFHSALLDRLAGSAAAPGASGMSDTMLARRLLRHDSSDGAFCMDATYMLVTHLAAGRGSDRARHILMVSRLVAIPEPTAPSKEPDFRGIGITEYVQTL
jgi:hypothetical protein